MLSKNIEKMKVDVASHIAADQVVQGQYWENDQGCFIGCLTHSNEAQGVTEKFGIPLPLVKIIERTFENLPEKEEVQLFADIPAAIDVDGKDLSLVHWKFLRDTLLRLPETTPEIQRVIDGISLLAEGKEWNKDEAEAASFAADRAVEAADAAKAAEAAARAAKEGFATEAAADAAWAASIAADEAGTSYITERRKQAQSIIQLLKDAPIKAAH